MERESREKSTPYGEKVVISGSLRRDKQKRYTKPEDRSIIPAEDAPAPQGTALEKLIVEIAKEGLRARNKALSSKQKRKSNRGK